MEITRFSELRPRTVWEIVDDALDLYRENLALFAGIVLLLFVPGALVYVGWIARIGPALLALEGSESSNPFPFLGEFLGGFALSMAVFGVVYLLYTGATAIAVQNRLASRTTTILAAYQQTLRRFWPLLGASLIVMLLAMLGACTMYILTIVVIVYYALVSQAVVLEGQGAIASGSRSRDLVSGNGMRVFGLIILLVLLSLALSFGVSMILQLAYQLVPALHGPDVAANERRQFLVEQACQIVASALIAPLMPIATTLMYYDLRVRREGMDMVAYAAEIGFPLAPDPFGGVAHPRTQPAPAGPETGSRG